MKITTLNVVMFAAGIILVYSGVKGYNPRDVIQWGLGGKKPKTFAEKDKDMATPKVPEGEHPGDQGYGMPGSPASDGSSGSIVQA